MTILAVIKNPKQLDLVLPWAAHFARARSMPLEVICWAHTPHAIPDGKLEACETFVVATREYLDDSSSFSVQELVKSNRVEVRGLVGRDFAASVVKAVLPAEIDLIVTAAEDPSGETGGTYATNPLLRQSPCNTAVLFGDSKRSRESDNVFVGVADTAHDTTAFFLASQMVERCESTVTLARTERDFEQVAFEVGRRELRQLMWDAGVESEKRIDCRVFRSGDRSEIAAAMDEHDLVLLGANTQLAADVLALTTKPTVALIKRAPPIRAWRVGKTPGQWTARLSPADYIDLVQGLRRGSRLSTDFLTMLCLATVVASLGLLQDSAAVVIGSMLLAPLMTPMLGCGLALAQANPKLGNSSLTSVAIGLLCTLGISLLIALITPAQELTPQIVARGNPTALDLVIAVTSSAAAAYALARPNLVGSIAGVAIATALVPPLCSVGLSLAHGQFATAGGAAILFTTNFVAIVLGAAATFRMMGVTSANVNERRRTWVRRVTAALCVGALILIVPLHLALLRSLVQPKPQPASFPLASSVIESLEDHLSKHPEVKLISAGHPSSQYNDADVILILGATKDVDRRVARDLIEIVRQEMADDSVTVEVHCIRELWQERTN